MKQSLSSLNFILKADIADFQKNLRAASTQLQRTGSDFQRTGATLSRNITAPILAATTALALLTNKTSESADAIEKMSVRTGMAMSSLQELSFVAGQIGVEMPNLESGLTRFMKSMGEASIGTAKQVEMFEKLGVSVVDSNGSLRSMNDVFPEVLDKLRGMKNETERNYITLELFGRSAQTSITPLVELGEKGLQQLIDRSHELGLVMEDEMIMKFVEFNDAQQQVKDQFSALGKEMTVGFADIMTNVVYPILNDRIIPALRNTVKWFQELPKPVKILSTVVIGLGAAVGPVMLAIGFMAKTVIPMMLIAVKSLTTAFTWLTTAIATNPIGALAVVLGAAAAAMLLFRKRTDEAATAQHKLGQEVDGVNEAVGKQIFDQLIGKQAEQAADGTYKLIYNLDKLREVITSLTAGELESLKLYLQKEYAEAVREAENATSEFQATMAKEDIQILKGALELVNAELEKMIVDEATVITTTSSLKDEISALEEQLWNEVTANDANAQSTARLLVQKQKELDLLKQKYELMKSNAGTAIPKMESLPGKVSDTTVGPPEAQMLFEKEIEQTNKFSRALKSLEKVSIDVNIAIQGAVAQMAEMFGETLAKLLQGTAKTQDIFNSILGMIGDFLQALGEALIASGVAALAFEELLSNPYAAIAAGIVLVALSALVTNLLSSGPSGEASYPSPSDNASEWGGPRAATGMVVTKPTILMAGEGGEPEGIFPIGPLMDSISQAVSMRDANLSVSGGMSAIRVKVDVEGRIRAGDMYLMNKTYNEKLAQLK